MNDEARYRVFCDMIGVRTHDHKMTEYSNLQNDATLHDKLNQIEEQVISKLEKTTHEERFINNYTTILNQKKLLELFV